MALPITGPVVENRSNNRNGPGSYRVYRQRYKQAPPYSLDMPFYSCTRRVLSADGVARRNGQLVEELGYANANVGYSPWQAFTYAADANTPEVAAAIQLARERFASAVSEQAQVAVNLAERESTKKMVAGKFVSLLRAYRSFRRGDFKSARKALKAQKKDTPTPDPRRFLKEPGQAWLEWHFGWKPLYGDIHRGMEILTSPYPVPTAIGRGRDEKSWRYDRSDYRCQHDAVAKATVRADVYIQNENLWMANQLGLLNPASVAWELVPFSFLIDWVANVGDFVAQFNEFTGLRLERPLTSWKFHVVSDCHYEEWYTPNSLTRRWTTVSEAISSGRELGIPAVKLRFKMPDRLSWQRGLTAAALMTGLLKGTSR